MIDPLDDALRATIADIIEAGTDQGDADRKKREQRVRDKAAHAEKIEEHPEIYGQGTPPKMDGVWALDSHVIVRPNRRPTTVIGWYPRELTIREKAPKAKPHKPSEPSGDIELVVDEQRQEVRRGNKVCKFRSRILWSLMYELREACGRLLEVDHLIMKADCEPGSITVHVSNLRKLLRGSGFDDVAASIKYVQAIERSGPFYIMDLPR